MIKKLILIATLLLGVNLGAQESLGEVNIESDSSKKIMMKVDHLDYINDNGEEVLSRVRGPGIISSDPKIMPYAFTFPLREGDIIEYSKDVSKDESKRKYKPVPADIMNKLKEGLKRADLVTLNVSPGFFSTKFQVEYVHLVKKGTLAESILSNSNDPAFNPKHEVNKLNQLEMEYLKNQLSAKYGDMAQTQEGRAQLKVRFDNLNSGNLTPFGRMEKIILGNIIYGYSW